MKLRQRILNAGAWTLGSYAIELVIQVLSNLIMTRLLFPEAFGLVAASSTLLIGLSLVSDLGIRIVIIQSAHGADAISCVGVGFPIVRGIALWLILI